MNEGWSNTKKNLKDFLNEQLRNKMEGIKVEKADRSNNGNDTGPWLLRAIEHIFVKPPLKKEEGTLWMKIFLKRHKGKMEKRKLIER